MAIKNTDIKLKGHGSFYLREGWFKKALQGIQNESFSKEKSIGIDELGIGSNMVQALKYWIKATGIAIDKKGKDNKNYLRLTEGFGDIINIYDSYLEEVGTVALIHYKLVNNFKMATSWSLFFNEMNTKEFTKKEAEDFIQKEISRLGCDNFSISSVESDIQCILKSYTNNSDNDEELNPEENNICPFIELGIISKRRKSGKRDIFEKKRIKKNKLNKLIFLYVILDKALEKNMKNPNTSIDNLLNERGNIGKTFNLDRTLINEYLDELTRDKYIEVNRTAGLDQIYFNFKKININTILEEYYKGIA